jgi:hypothetical protein
MHARACGTLKTRKFRDVCACTTCRIPCYTLPSLYTYSCLQSVPHSATPSLLLASPRMMPLGCNVQQ